VESLARLRSRSCIIDGEAVACDDNGIASFDLVRHHRANGSVFLYAFDLIELNGDDLRRDPLEVRKATLASVLAKAGPGIRFQRAYRRRRPDRLSPTPARWGLKVSCRSGRNSAVVPPNVLPPLSSGDLLPPSPPTEKAAACQESDRS
jgi:ATP-dependent DNA ligase